MGRKKYILHVITKDVYAKHEKYNGFFLRIKKRIRFIILGLANIMKIFYIHHVDIVRENVRSR